MSKSNSTKVALVCLKTSQNITNQSLLQVFGKHGKITKILIFEQGPMQTKVFIEYEDPEQAQDAINCLNNTKVMNNIICNVYPSRLRELKLDNVPNTKGMDLTQKLPFSMPSLWDLNVNEDESTLQVSEEKLVDIRKKLSMIDDEISRTIENKLDNALIKLYQQTKCLRVLMGDYQLDEILHKTSKYGKIVYLKQAQQEVYVKYDSDKECLQAYEELKDQMIVQIKYNFESIPGYVMVNSNY
ncbi:unnamed protein product [Paramecium pentaurelia]|uniref:RRM domain-containing protein n=1 Tax=Paramecium pentaurelia TaxID=43138 RepID=A0A8S1VGE2_9CILI|nr:unnamed protein product [Paramecium pentaurelia]